MYWHTYLCTLFMYLHVWTYNHYSVQCSVHVTLDCTCTLFMYLHVWTYNHYSVQCSVHVTLDCTCTLLLIHKTIVFFLMFVFVCIPLHVVEAIEVMDTVAVSAFGKPLPLIKPRLAIPSFPGLYSSFCCW